MSPGTPPGLSFAGAGAAEHGARTRLADRGRQRRAEVEQISGRRNQATAAYHPLDETHPSQGDQHGDRAPPRGDLDALARLDVAQIFAGPLSQLAHTDRFHRATL